MIYLDHAATTPVPQEVADAMYQVLTEQFGNPSAQYGLGLDMKKRVESWRQTVAAAMGCDAKQLYFTSCGTEGDNWAVTAGCWQNRHLGKHIVTTAVEHNAVLECCKWMEKQGYEVTYVAPDGNGDITARQVLDAVRPDTALVSVMLVNNELGNIYPIADIARGLTAKNPKTLLHTDAVQGFLKVPFTAKALGADFITISAHKIGGPKGAGALYIGPRVRNPRPLLAGGGRWGAVPGAVLGCVPQCGFSAIASNFYASRVITLGTLMAVYLATSDEAIPLLVSMPAYWDKLILLMVIKVVYAVFVGFLLDFVLRKALPRSLRGGYTGHADEVDCHEEHSDEEGHPQPIWKAALRHTLEIFVFIFVFSLVFGLIVEGVGEDVFASVLGRMGFFQPVVAALVGLVPNCAASVLMTQLYVEGALRFSSLVAGLCTGAGVGLAVLWRVNPSWKQNLFITGLTWGAGAFLGVAMQVVVAVFA